MLGTLLLILTPINGLCLAFGSWMTYLSCWMFSIWVLNFFSGNYFWSEVCESEQICTKDEPDHIEVTKKQDLHSVLDCIDTGIINQVAQPQHSSYLNVKASLEKVFDCLYNQLFLPCYNDPKPDKKDQVLYRVLQRNFTRVIDHVIERATHINLQATAVDFIRIVTSHLKEIKQNPRRMSSLMRHDEITFLRKCSKTFISDLPVLDRQVNDAQELLTEILAFRVQSIVNLMSDPDFINQRLISILSDSECEVSNQQQFAVEMHGNFPQKTGDETEQTPPPEKQVKVVPKKKRKERIKKFARRFTNGLFKSKRNRAQPVQLSGTCMLQDADIECDGMESTNNFNCQFISCTTESLHMAFTEESDIECDSVESADSLDFVHSVWQGENWTMTVTELSLEHKELSCTLRLQRRDGITYLDLKKSLNDLENLRRSTNQVSFPKLIYGLCTIQGNLPDELLEEAKAVLNIFLLELNEKEQYRNEIFKFLFSEEESVEMNNILGDLFFNNDFVSEDTEDENKGEKESDSSLDCNSEDLFSQENDLQTDAVPCFEETRLEFRPMMSAYCTESKRLCLKKSSPRKAKLRKKQHYVDKKRLLEKEAFGAVLDLVKQICDSKLSRMILFIAGNLKIIPEKFTNIWSYVNVDEKIIESYIDSLRDALWPNGLPQETCPERTPEEKLKTKEEVQNLLHEKLNTYSVYVLVKSRNITEGLAFLQNADDNKLLLYKLLFHFLNIFIPENKILSTENIPWINAEDYNQ
ncbi:uncharacterized protein si:rp71-46j2.7 isoform X2 [Polypterus senegalus]|uniref:uncharacterized protein si:rp71-46j2.7 isoform X2 n=1 Tax=Polypterus senegalus TaxID=55291 RepID=UPI001966C78F|nr:uncharacterized protein si:rp71-46j2.7 isoform X2 [Polypterus senegalus]